MCCRISINRSIDSTIDISSDAPEWNSVSKALKKELLNDRDDGEFWMCWDDFKANWTKVEVKYEENQNEISSVRFAQVRSLVRSLARSLFRSHAHSLVSALIAQTLAHLLNRSLAHSLTYPPRLVFDVP